MKKFLAVVFSFVCALFAVGGHGVRAFAAFDDPERANIESQLKAEIESFVEADNEIKTRDKRVPGSSAERTSALYIKQEMLKLENFEPVNNTTTTDGIEPFEFKNQYSGAISTSQNVIFEKKNQSMTDKKIIIAAHYDTSFVIDQRYDDLGIGYGIVSEGINDNAASVALLLCLAKELDNAPDLGFNIEIVFFGAGSNDYAGSRFYSRGMSDQDAKNVLLMINLDKIALGAHTYIYTNEYVSSQQNYYFKLLKDFEFKKFQSKNFADYKKESPNGLEYSHIALEGDHAIFIGRNINVLSFFSGYYENFLTMNVQEYDDETAITFTENDNLEYISERHPEYLSNLSNIYLAVRSLISDKDFVAEMEKDNNSKGFYAFWTNQKLAVFLTLVLFAAILIIVVYIYRDLSRKSRENFSQADVLSIIGKITMNIDAELDDDEDDDQENKDDKE